MKDIDIRMFYLFISQIISIDEVRFFLKKSTVAVLLILFCWNISAQSGSVICSCDEQTDLGPAGIMTGHRPMAHMWMFSYGYMSSILNGNITGASKVNDSYIFERYIMVPRQMQMDMHMLMGMYGLSDKLSVMLMLNYQAMNMTMDMLSSTMQMNGSMNMTGSPMEMTSTSHGFGDSKVIAAYSLVSGMSHSVVLDVGISIPTGSVTKADLDNAIVFGERFSYMMQPGSGTFDLLPGITYTYHKQNFAWSAQLLSVLHPYDNKAGYRAENEVTVDTWVAYHWLKWFSSSIRISGNYESPIQGHDSQIYATYEPAANPSNYGKKKATALFGINYFFKDELLQHSKIAVEYGIPIVQYVNGIQLASKYTLYVTWFMHF